MIVRKNTVTFSVELTYPPAKLPPLPPKINLTFVNQLSNLTTFLLIFILYKTYTYSCCIESQVITYFQCFSIPETIISTQQNMSPLFLFFSMDIFNECHLQDEES